MNTGDWLDTDPLEDSGDVAERDAELEFEAWLGWLTAEAMGEPREGLM